MAAATARRFLFGGFVKEVVPAFFFGEDVALVVKAVIAADFFLSVGDEKTAVKRLVQHVHDRGSRLRATVTQNARTHHVWVFVKLDRKDRKSTRLNSSH